MIHIASIGFFMILSRLELREVFLVAWMFLWFSARWAPYDRYKGRGNRLISLLQTGRVCRHPIFLGGTTGPKIGSQFVKLFHGFLVAN